jgi:dihydrofolate reductase
MNAIYCSSLNHCIGKIDGGLIYKIKEDMKFFVECTKGTVEKPSVLIVGYKTYKELPIDKITKHNRVIWVLSKEHKSTNESVVFFRDVESCLSSYTKSKYNYWVIGGASIYKLFEEHVDIIYRCEVQDVYLGPAVKYDPGYNKYMVLNSVDYRLFKFIIYNKN